MVNSNVSALGILFPNTYDALVPELVNVRLMASIPFASRYRMIDFVLSSMSNNGIDTIAVMANKNYLSLMDHLGSGREWDLVRKSGGLHMFPPFVANGARPYVGRIGALAGILDYLRSKKEKYAVIADCNIAVNFDFSDMITKHIESGADITMAYHVEELPASVRAYASNDKGFYYTLGLEEGRVKKLYINSRAEGLQNFSMNIIVLSRELLIELVDQAFIHGQEYFERDVVLQNLDNLNVRGYEFKGYMARISSLKSYFDESMKLLEDENLDGLFSGPQIYTKIRDDNPTRYIAGATAKNVMVADGCIIEGEVENSVIFRGVRIGKGARVKNCVLMQDTIIGEGAEVEYLVTDKEVTVSAGKVLKGTDTYPVYIAKFQTV